MNDTLLDDLDDINVRMRKDIRINRPSIISEIFSLPSLPHQPISLKPLNATDGVLVHAKKDLNSFKKIRESDLIYLSSSDDEFDLDTFNSNKKAHVLKHLGDVKKNSHHTTSDLLKQDNIQILNTIFAQCNHNTNIQTLPINLLDETNNITFEINNADILIINSIYSLTSEVVPFDHNTINDYLNIAFIKKKGSFHKRKIIVKCGKILIYANNHTTPDSPSNLYKLLKNSNITPLITIHCARIFSIESNANQTSNGKYYLTLTTKSPENSLMSIGVDSYEQRRALITAILKHVPQFHVIPNLLTLSDIDRIGYAYVKDNLVGDWSLGVVCIGGGRRLWFWTVRDGRSATRDLRIACRLTWHRDDLLIPPFSLSAKPFIKSRISRFRRNDRYMQVAEPHVSDVTPTFFPRRYAVVDFSAASPLYLAVAAHEESSCSERPDGDRKSSFHNNNDLLDIEDQKICRNGINNHNGNLNGEVSRSEKLGFEPRRWLELLHRCVHYNGPALKDQRLCLTTSSIAVGHNDDSMSIISDENSCRRAVVPIILEKLINFVTDYGLETKGIYRLNGSQCKIETLMNHLTNTHGNSNIAYSSTLNVNNSHVTTNANNCDSAFDSLPSFVISRDIFSEHDVANALKRYLRNLPEALIPEKSLEKLKETAFLSLNEKNDAQIVDDKQVIEQFDNSNTQPTIGNVDETLKNLNTDYDKLMQVKIKAYKSILSSADLMPELNYSTLRRLLGHLYYVSLHESKNNMSVQNLASILGPGIMAPRVNKSPEFEDYNDTNGYIIVLCDLIANYCPIFDVAMDQFEKEKKIREGFKKMVLAKSRASSRAGEFLIPVYISHDLVQDIKLNHITTSESDNVSCDTNKNIKSTNNGIVDQSGPNFLLLKVSSKMTARDIVITCLSTPNTETGSETGRDRISEEETGTDFKIRLNAILAALPAAPHNVKRNRSSTIDSQSTSDIDIGSNPCVVESIMGGRLRRPLKPNEIVLDVVPKWTKLSSFFTFFKSDVYHFSKNGNDDISFTPGSNNHKFYSENIITNGNDNSNVVNDVINFQSPTLILELDAWSNFAKNPIVPFSICAELSVSIFKCPLIISPTRPPSSLTEWSCRRSAKKLSVRPKRYLVEFSRATLSFFHPKKKTGTEPIFAVDISKLELYQGLPTGCTNTNGDIQPRHGFTLFCDVSSEINHQPNSCANSFTKISSNNQEPNYTTCYSVTCNTREEFDIWIHALFKTKYYP
ncbi:unnamed protein product [Gordionus sp. m RMFG-2023]|uniref:uncharacterized protein LOC135931200 n=1 Tax=Gordionus sp. m RMFG-2023 TaxID=3053472 RepID=UPI0030DF0350